MRGSVDISMINAKILNTWFQRIIILGFIIWAMAFIFSSSSITFQGERVFCLFDDAMISMRYAWNFSHGYGLVWNPGEYVQGYSNFLQVLVMSLATFLFEKSGAVLSIQILGLFICLIIGLLSRRIFDQLEPDINPSILPWMRSMVLLSVLAYYPLAYWTLLGMETGLLCLLFLGGLSLSFSYLDVEKPSKLLALGIVSGLAFLTRNDSILLFALIWFFTLWETIKVARWRQQIVSVLVGLFIFSGFVIGQLIFQKTYYGEYLPNTYTLKLVGLPFLNRIQNGLGFVSPFLKGTTPLWLLASLDTIFKFKKKKLILLALAALTVVYQIYVGGDPWIYWRMMSPAMPLLFILFIVSGANILLSIHKAEAFRAYFIEGSFIPNRNYFAVLLVLFTLFGIYVSNKQFLLEIFFLEEPPQITANHDNVNTAFALNELTTSQATVGVFWAGTIPYYTERAAVDFLGKSDRRIANLKPDPAISWHGMAGVPGHDKYDLNYSIKELKPTYLQYSSWGSQDLSDYTKEKYLRVVYKGIVLQLEKGSPHVLWGKIDLQ